MSSVDERAKVLVLLRLHGWNATSFQGLEPGFQYWFDGEDACVAYVETRRAWVAAGAPICAVERLAEVVARFVERARLARKRCAFFGAEQRLVDATHLAAMVVGEQAVWDPRAWPQALATNRNLREQLRRASAKGVVVRAVGPAELDAARPLRGRIETLIERWQHQRPMAPMGFLVDVQPFDFAEERRYFVAERGDEVVGFLDAVPVFSRDGWLLEDFLRDPASPNGTSELLIDAAMHALASEGSSYVTMGLAPLSGPMPGPLRAIRRVTRALYDFGGLRAFKEKLRPTAWVPIYLAHPHEVSSHVALLDALAAFARGSFLRFGLATLLRGPAVVVRALATLLVPWTIVLALADARWFPSSLVRWTWVAFDATLVLALISVTRRWRHRLAVAIASAISVDAGLTAIQVGVFNAPRARGSEWIALAISIAGPLFASLVLWTSIGHRRSLPPPRR